MVNLVKKALSFKQIAHFLDNGSISPSKNQIWDPAVKMKNFRWHGVQYAILNYNPQIACSASGGV